MKAIELLKEQLTLVKFPKNDVLSTDSERKMRLEKLNKAMTLGNVYKGKSKIYFKSEVNECFSIDTTVWSVGDKYITLKGGKTIPLHAINEVDY